MKKTLGSLLLFGLASISQGMSELPPDAKYSFATRDYLIEMKVTFFAPYLGRRLAFSSNVDPRQQLCYSIAGGAGPCIEQFVGAVAIVKYFVKLANSSGPPKSVSIRECVTVSAQSAGLPERAPFSMTQKLVKGIGSDIQAFGYDQSSLNKADRIRIRDQAQAIWWRLCKQELYMNRETKPFAIVEWKHTLNRISITQICTPPN